MECEMEMEWNKIGWSGMIIVWAAITYIQNIQLVVKDKTSVVQVYALKEVIFFEDIKTVSPLSRISSEGNWNCERALMYL